MELPHGYLDIKADIPTTLQHVGLAVDYYQDDSQRDINVGAEVAVGRLPCGDTGVSYVVSCGDSSVNGVVQFARVGDGWIDVCTVVLEGGVGDDFDGGAVVAAFLKGVDHGQFGGGGERQEGGEQVSGRGERNRENVTGSHARAVGTWEARSMGDESRHTCDI